LFGQATVIDGDTIEIHSRAFGFGPAGKATRCGWSDRTHFKYAHENYAESQKVALSAKFTPGSLNKRRRSGFADLQETNSKDPALVWGIIRLGSGDQSCRSMKS
jgi:hypothetical protein